MTYADGPATATPPVVGQPDPDTATPTDALPNPISDKQDRLRQEAVAQVLKGETKPRRINGNRVVRLGDEPAAATSQRGHTRRSQAKTERQPQYVELDNERTDRVFVFLVEFGDERHPDFPDQDTDPDTEGPARFDGPRFNEIPEPGPNDNTTQWEPEYDREYYEDLYFGEGQGVESLKTYYEKQSSGRYSVEGNVTEFTKVQYNQARYGRSNGEPCAGIVCNNTWALIEDGMEQWVEDQRAAGKSDAAIREELATFDVRDRYDYDGDGNFDEPDGYLDRFQIVHAGGDQADGDPIYGEDAIWSHRWYTNYQDFGQTGPSENLSGGTEIGDTGLWVGDYTVQPENGGLSVIAHEYGHDLGLPDHYDTAASGDNPVSWWTLMAQSRVSAKGDQGLGTRAADLGVWDKLQLGWLDYETVVAGQNRKIDLGPHEYNSPRAQGVAVVLPDKEVTTDLPDPAEGEQQWWSGSGDDYTATMSRADLEVPAAGAQLDLKLNYNIEEDYDYGYLEVEVPAGSGNWTTLPTDQFDDDGDGAAVEDGIDGVSGGYVDASYDLTPYAGQTIGFRAQYRTDGAVQGQDPELDWSGLFVDDIVLTSGGQTLFADGAENPPNGWSLNGFQAVGGEQTQEFDQFYLASNRAYVSYDRYLETGPYNFGFPEQPDRAEHFPYQNGLLVNYWDTSYTDNNTSQHPGHGLVLPVDAHPEVDYNLEGEAWRGRIQTYDAPFGKERVDSFPLHVDGKRSYVRGGKGNNVFKDNDPDRYYAPYAEAGMERIGVKVAGAGVKIKVLKQKGPRMTIRVR
ncbi:immune inhibitor A [Nocardioides panacisoli]|uniref:immune inhibitor A domain-containing protein n=1 Tax=Nocardioides panacisoli TaxID=627624 RepID=UPI001C62EB74|nr:immune inhibitor A domain-containing protein [Nocardioides panacisoli]QYJ05609.1 immune inhibitor A [Nocardioides panacisoli]